MTRKEVAPGPPTGSTARFSTQGFLPKCSCSISLQLTPRFVNYRCPPEPRGESQGGWLDIEIPCSSGEHCGPAHEFPERLSVLQRAHSAEISSTRRDHLSFSTCTGPLDSSISHLSSVYEEIDFLLCGDRPICTRLQVVVTIATHANVSKNRAGIAPILAPTREMTSPISNFSQE